MLRLTDLLNDSSTFIASMFGSALKGLKGNLKRYLFKVQIKNLPESTELSGICSLKLWDRCCLLFVKLWHSSSLNLWTVTDCDLNLLDLLDGNNVGVGGGGDDLVLLDGKVVIFTLDFLSKWFPEIFKVPVLLIGFDSDSSKTAFRVVQATFTICWKRPSYIHIFRLWTMYLVILHAVNLSLNLSVKFSQL